MQFRSLEDFVAARLFKRGAYDVEVTQEGSARRPLLRLSFDRDDEHGVRRVAAVFLPPDLDPYPRSLVASALVRAGAQHPGLRDEDLATLHREASREHHVELFTDLNALTTGLLRHVVLSLGGAVARVVISSSSIDILHEYQGRLSRNTAQNGDFLRRAEMTRALRLLEEMRRDAPVHVHQLPPGASRYFARSSASPARRPQPPAGRDEGASADLDELTFISEDRQMIAAYWDYMARANTRLPVRLITSDFALAHVCVAERVPLLFARSPYEIWRDPEGSMGHPPRVLWLDPFALSLRFATPHAILWELCAVFERLIVNPKNLTEDAAFSLVYNPRSHLPGSAMTLREESATLEAETMPPAKPLKKAPSAGTKRKITKATLSVEHRKPAKAASIEPSLHSLTLRLPFVIDVLPAKPGGHMSLATFKAKDKSALKQLGRIGEATGLYHVSAEGIEAGPALANLLESLEAHDYIAVNAIFRKVPAYDEALREAATSGAFANTKSGGAATGWAVMLGAGYKTHAGARYGLAAVSVETFAAAIVQAHTECGQGQPAVPLPAILDHVCRSLSYSPVRFEAMLDEILGDGTLSGYEAQRATVAVDLPEHDVLVSPSAAENGHFLRHLAPGKGVMLGGVLVSSLVRRSGGS